MSDVTPHPWIDNLSFGQVAKPTPEDQSQEPIPAVEWIDPNSPFFDHAYLELGGECGA